jgi:hypothetical protein
MLRLDDLHVDSFATTTAVPAALAIPTTTAGGTHLGCTEYSCYTVCPITVDTGSTVA